MVAFDERWPWFAVQVRTCYETTASRFLQNCGYECFLPVVKTRRRWSDRIKESKAPLFTGYLFCRFDIHNRLPILKTPGVLQIVGTGKIPIPVDDAEIEAIRCLEKSGLPAQPWPFLQAGQLTRIKNGPLSGMTGIVVEVKSELRVVLSVTLLRRSVAVELDRGWLSEPYSASSAAPSAKLSIPAPLEPKILTASQASLPSGTGLMRRIACAQ